MRSFFASAALMLVVLVGLLALALSAGAEWAGG
jgi:hypothetical protein